MSAAQGPSARFVSLEGIEGSGKTTHARLLVEWLRAAGHEVVAVREPGGTALGERIRALLLEQSETGMSPWCELALYMAARAQLVREVIEPALARGAMVIADRFGEASVAYQGGGRGLGRARVRSLYGWVTGGLFPDRVILLDLDPREGMRRIVASRGTGGLDRLEREPLAFHRRVRNAYRAEARREPARFSVLDADDAVETVQRRIREEFFTIRAEPAG